jgi:hypothetical protein
MSKTSEQSDLVTHFVSALNGRNLGTLCGRDFAFPLRGNGWRVEHVTCPECSRQLCDFGHEHMKARALLSTDVGEPR